MKERFTTPSLPSSSSLSTGHKNTVYANPSPSPRPLGLFRTNELKWKYLRHKLLETFKINGDGIFYVKYLRAFSSLWQINSSPRWVLPPSLFFYWISTARDAADLSVLTSRSSWICHNRPEYKSRVPFLIQTHSSLSSDWKTLKF